MKKISLLNPYSFYYLWNHEIGKNYITDLINCIIGENNKYTLLTLFNNQKNNVRSYVVFKSRKTIVFVDFNFEKNNKLFKLDLFMYNYLKATSKQKVKLIIFNNFSDENNRYENYYDIYNNSENSKEINLLFEDNYSKQKSINSELTNLLYQMDDETYELYLHENELKSNL